jgi:hypothetical protein
VFQFEAGSIDNQARGRLCDAPYFDETMRFQRIAGFDQINDPVSQTDNRCEFDGPIELDDFDRDAMLVKIAFRNLRIFGCDTDF